jgi:type II secretion system protein H
MSPRRLRQRRARAAYTLVELVVVVLILGIAAAAAAPRYRSAHANYRVNAAAGRIAADLRMIRQYARKVSEPQSLQFDATGNSYTASMPDVNRPANAYNVSLWNSEYMTDIVSASFGGSGTIQFDIYGRPNAAGSVVVRSGSLQRTIEVNEAGHVRIL